MTQWSGSRLAEPSQQRLSCSLNTIPVQSSDASGSNTLGRRNSCPLLLLGRAEEKWSQQIALFHHPRFVGHHNALQLISCPFRSGGNSLCSVATMPVETSYSRSHIQSPSGHLVIRYPDRPEDPNLIYEREIIRGDQRAGYHISSALRTDQLGSRVTVVPQETYHGIVSKPDSRYLQIYRLLPHAPLPSSKTNQHCSLQVSTYQNSRNSRLPDSWRARDACRVCTSLAVDSTEE